MQYQFDLIYDITVELIDNPTCGTHSVFDSIPGMLQGIQYQKEQLYCLPLIRLKTYHTNKIEKVQRRAARWVSNDYSSYSSVTDMLSNLGWQSLENRRTNTHLAMFYNFVNGLVAIPLPLYFEHPEVYTRQMHSFSYRQIHTSVCYYKYSFFTMPIVLWNKLPADLILVPDLAPFKT